MKRGGRTIALSTAAMAMVILVAAAILAKDRILEQWYLWRLEVGSEEEQADAAERLGELRSVRAVPALVAMFKKASWNSLETIRSDGSAVAYLFDPGRGQPFLSALDRIGKPAIGALLKALTDAKARGEGWDIAEVLREIYPSPKLFSEEEHHEAVRNLQIR